MKRKCTVCKTVTSDDRLIACPECGADFNSGEPDRNLLTPQQEKYIVAQIWKRHWTFLFGGFSVLTIISVALLAMALVRAYKAGTAHLEETLVSKVSKEFEDSRIQTVVSNVASSKAEALLLNQIQPQVATFKADVAKKNEIAEERLRTLMAELEAVTEYTRTVVAAQNDDRKAFDKLEAWSQNKDHQFSEEAQQAWTTIFESHSKPFHTSGFTMPWVEGFDHSKLTLLELQDQFARIPSQLKPALLEYIWKRNDFSKIDRLDFMIKVMETDDSLAAVEYAGRHFTSGTDQKIKPIAVKYLSTWWKENRQKVKDKKPNN